MPAPRPPSTLASTLRYWAGSATARLPAGRARTAAKRLQRPRWRGPVGRFVRVEEIPADVLIATTVDNIQRTILLDRSYEPEDTARLRSALADGGVLVDVGANIGWYTLHGAAAVGPSGRVIAVEPAGPNLDVLRANVERNGFEQVRVFPVAAGAVRGDARFEPGRDGQDGWGGLDPAGSSTVPVRTLDEILAEVAPERIDVVKIDVEGGEPDVLAGATETMGLLADSGGTAIIEINLGRLGHRGLGRDDVVDLLPAGRARSMSPPSDETVSNLLVRF